MHLFTAAVGFYGQLSFPLEPETIMRVMCPFSSPYQLWCQEAFVLQWTDPLLPASAWPDAQGEVLLVAGMLHAPSTVEATLHQLTQALREKQVDALPAGDYCACLIRRAQLVFAQMATSNETIFYRQEGRQVFWSTNPADLAAVLDNAALARCCAGDNPFVYQDVCVVEGGSVVCIDAEHTQTVTAEAEAPLPLPSSLSLREAALMTRTALLDATRPLRGCSRVGLLLSGGIDSSALAAALVEHGVEVVAYHFAFPGSAADESPYAQAVCKALRLPFIPVEVNPGNADYLSSAWRFPHPYSHAGFAWMVEVAESVARDGIQVLVTGRGGDLAFSPADAYGVADILRSPLPRREKWMQIVGACSTTWQLSEVLKSLSPSFSLISHRSLSVARSSDEAREPAIPFLLGQVQRVLNRRVFSPHDLVLEQVVWRPRGIHVVHPYYTAAITRLARSLPSPYLLLPYRGMKVAKPTLRLAFADRLPPLVVRHRWGSWLDAPGQRYCLEQTAFLAHLIGGEEAEVVKRGLVEQAALHTLLADGRAIRRHYMALLATAMTELFLRQWEASRHERRRSIGLHLSA
jgi:hypothetical protein